MALPATGLQTRFGIGEESTYGTAVAPSRFIPIESESLQLKNDNITSNAMLPGLYNARLASRRVQSTRSVEGDFKCDVTTRGMGLLTKHCMGAAATVTTTNPFAGVYQHVIPLASNLGKSLTIQKQFYNMAGTAVQAFDISGAKIASAEFGISTDSMLTLTAKVDARDEQKQASPTAASYTALNPYYFKQATAIKVNGSTIASDIIVKDASVSIEHPMDVDRRGLGNAGLKGEQIENDFAKVTGKLSCEFVRAADWYDAFNSQTAIALEIWFEGSTIASTFKETFKLVLPAVFLEGESPKASGPGTVAMTIPFTALSDGTNAAVTTTIITSESTLV